MRDTPWADTTPTTGEAAVRHPRAEAQGFLGSAGAARVLEPSPPANNDEPFFADDPVAVDDTEAGPVVLPAGMASATSSPAVSDWDAWLVDHPDHHDWVARHWLGGRRRLSARPDSLSATREALHRLAAYVVAPARHAVNGKFGLRWTAGGFGTPFFGNDRQIRVEGATLVDQRGDSARSTPITSLQAAADFLAAQVDPATAAEHDSPPVGDVDIALDIDPESAEFLGQWFGMAFAALERLRADPASIDPSRPQLWPGHFDPALEVGSEDSRASYGASPGDHSIDEPYLYVSLWWPDRLAIDQTDRRWNAPGFVGRILRLSEFAEGADPVEVAAGFWIETRDLVH